MRNITLYHGSENIVSNPDIMKGTPYNDFGPGFYCTKSPELAGRWACARGRNGFINEYVLNIQGLRIVDLSDKRIDFLYWLEAVLENRAYRISDSLVFKFREFLRKKYKAAIDSADVIVGARCDDSVFSCVKRFLEGSISISQLQELCSAKKSENQYVIVSEKAFEAIRFSNFQRADANIYFPERKGADEALREKCAKFMDGKRGGIYLEDILDGKGGY